jgi:dTDP-4-amino-4,6-dideoxygalactose transaminase
VSQLPSPIDEIPLVDLALQHAEVVEEIEQGFARVVASSAYIRGPEVEAFESEFAAYAGVLACVGVANGTDAVELALRALGIGPGCEVVMAANTFVATAEAAERAGATVVLADCDPSTLLLDPEVLGDRISPRVRAIVPTHLYGQIAPMSAIGAIAERHGAVVVEDAAQAQGARQHGQGIGQFGHAAATSFYPGKNLGAYGDGGAVLTGDESVASFVRSFGGHGVGVSGHHELVGTNSRLDSLQAVVLRAKLRRLDAWNRRRVVAAARYDALLTDVEGIRLPVTAPGNAHVWHLYVVRVPRRDEIVTALHHVGIRAGVHYRHPVHLEPAFAHLGYVRGDFPVAEAATDEVLSLPLYPGITEAQQRRVCDVLRKAMGLGA